jgi:hypothetical protein
MVFDMESSLNGTYGDQESASVTVSASHSRDAEMA